MNVMIGNEQLQVTINTMGAEIKSVKSVGDEHEYMWPGSADSWTSSAPILFPIIGALNDDAYTYDGKAYGMKSHGFARKMEFEVQMQTQNFAMFVLQVNEETKKQYPFDFGLALSYRLEGNTIHVSYLVHNGSAEEMLFSIGAHPGFKCPMEEGLSFDDYRIVFNEKETSSRRFKGEKVLTGVRAPYLEDDDTIDLKHELFTEGALIFDDLSSTKITVESEKGKRRVSMDFTGFPYFGIWSYPAKPQEFICLEPWFGVDSTEGDDTDLRKKEGMLCLPPDEDFTAGYTITIK